MLRTSQLLLIEQTREPVILLYTFQVSKDTKTWKLPEKTLDLFITAEILEKTILHTNVKSDECHLHYNFYIACKQTYLKLVDVLEMWAF